MQDSTTTTHNWREGKESLQAGQACRQQAGQQAQQGPCDQLQFHWSCRGRVRSNETIMYLATETLIRWVPLLLLGRRLSWEWETGTGHRLGRQETKQSHFQESSGCVLTGEQMHYWQEFRKLTLEGGCWRQDSRHLPAENLDARWHQMKTFQFQVVMQETKQDHRSSVRIHPASLQQWKVGKRPDLHSILDL